METNVWQRGDFDDRDLDDLVGRTLAGGVTVDLDLTDVANLRLADLRLAHGGLDGVAANRLGQALLLEEAAELPPASWAVRGLERVLSLLSRAPEPADIVRPFQASRRSSGPVSVTPDGQTLLTLEQYRYSGQARIGDRLFIFEPSLPVVAASARRLDGRLGEGVGGGFMEPSALAEYGYAMSSHASRYNFSSRLPDVIRPSQVFRHREFNLPLEVDVRRTIATIAMAM